MKIIFTQQACPFFWGLSQVIKAIGEDVFIWNKQSSFVDMLDTIKPDLIFIEQSDVSPEVVFGLNNSGAKVIFYGLNVSGAIKPPDVLYIPESIPDKIFEESNLPKEIPTIKSTKAADIVSYRMGYFNYKAQSDILLITTTELFKIPQSIEHVNKILSDTDWVIKCVGEYIPSPAYLGNGDKNLLAMFMKSAKIALDYNYHMLYTLIANKVFTITNQKQDLIPYFESEEDLTNIIGEFIENEKARRSIVKRAHQHIINNNTYFHELLKLNDILQIGDWNDKIHSTLKKYR